tara:strand:+ start:184 stop:339 length:156 start_codon:yes stop_codon:yes gene_type:complete
MFWSKPKGKRIAHSKMLFRKILKERFSVPNKKETKYKNGTKLNQITATIRK